MYDLGFEIRDTGGKDGVLLPPTDINQVLNRIQRVPNFNQNAWNEGYNLGNL